MRGLPAGASECALGAALASLLGVALTSACRATRDAGQAVAPTAAPSAAAAAPAATTAAAAARSGAPAAAPTAFSAQGPRPADAPAALPASGRSSAAPAAGQAPAAARDPAPAGTLAAVQPLLLLTQVPARAAGAGADQVQAWERGGLLPDGARIVLVDPAHPGAPPRLLTEGFAAAGRPDLSEDAQRFLFVGRRAAGDRQQVWEADLAGGEPRQVTRRTRDSQRAIHLAMLYTIDAERPEPRLCLQSEDEPGVPSLHSLRMDGTDERRLTFHPRGATSPLLLADGRLLFLGGLPAAASGAADGAAPQRAAALYTVNVDGTDVQAFAAVEEPPAWRAALCQTDDGRVIWAEERAAGGTALVAVPATRSLRLREELLRAPSGRVLSAAALDAATLAVCWRPEVAASSGAADGGAGTAAGGAADAAAHGAPEGATYDVFRVALAAPRRLERLIATDGWHEIEALPVRPRARRPGRSSVVDEQGALGWIYCLDAALTDPASALPALASAPQQVQILKALSGAGRAPGARPGDAGGVYPPGAGEGAQATGKTPGGIEEQVLGVAQVESDGSFQVGVPARTPLRLRLLDAQGQVLRDMQSWFWVMPKEPRGCIGCHADPELTPPNRQPLALRRTPQELR